MCMKNRPGTDPAIPRLSTSFGDQREGSERPGRFVRRDLHRHGLSGVWFFRAVPLPLRGFTFLARGGLVVSCRVVSVSCHIHVHVI